MGVVETPLFGVLGEKKTVQQFSWLHIDRVIGADPTSEPTYNPVDMCS